MAAGSSAATTAAGAPANAFQPAASRRWKASRAPRWLTRSLSRRSSTAPRMRCQTRSPGWSRNEAVLGQPGLDSGEGVERAGGGATDRLGEVGEASPPVADRGAAHVGEAGDLVRRDRRLGAAPARRPPLHEDCPFYYPPDRSGAKKPFAVNSTMCSAARCGAAPPYTSSPASMLRLTPDWVRLALDTSSTPGRPPRAWRASWRCAASAAPAASATAAALARRRTPPPAPRRRGRCPHRRGSRRRH